MNEFTKGIIIVAIITILGAFIMAEVGDISSKIAKQTISEAQTNGYTYYYEGKEVDPTKFNPHYYDYFYNHEDKTVIMERKRARYYGYGVWR